MSISSSAVLVKLSISTWTAKKLDKIRTEKVITDNRAIGKAAEVRKNLMAGTQKVKDICDFAAMVRTENNRLTLPWEDRGNRVLPVSMLLDYKQKFNQYRNQFFQMRGDLILNYDALKQTARNYLNDMYDEDDYPDASEVVGKYDWQMVFSPLPDAGHFFLDIPATELDEIKDSLRKENDDRLQTATRTAWDRMHKLLSGMTEKLADTNDDETKRWHQSFVTNAQELCGMLTHLNITKDPELERARQMLEATMYGADIEQLRQSPTVRSIMKHKVDTILEQFEW